MPHLYTTVVVEVSERVNSCTVRLSDPKYVGGTSDVQGDLEFVRRPEWAVVGARVAVSIGADERGT